MKKAIYLLVFIFGGLFAKAQTTASRINISKLIVYEKDSRLFLDWATDGTKPTNYWEVQSSTDGKKFSTIALVLGPDPSQQGDEYRYKGSLDKRGAEYFRVVHIGTAGEIQQSNVIKLMKLEAVSFVNPDIKNKVPAVL